MGVLPLKASSIKISQISQLKKNISPKFSYKKKKTTAAFLFLGGVGVKGGCGIVAGFGVLKKRPLNFTHLENVAPQIGSSSPQFEVKMKNI